MRFALLALVAFVLIAGCTGAPDDNSTTPTGGSGPIAGDGGSGGNEPTANTGMLSYCLGFAHDGVRSMCAAVFNGDYEMCDDVTSVHSEMEWDDEHYRQQCKVLVAAVNNDASLCEKVASDYAGTPIATMVDCYHAVAVTNLDPAPCAKAGSKNTCELDVKMASGKGALADCKTASGYYLDCLWALAETTRSGTVCDAMAENPVWGPMATACRAMLAKDENMCKGLGVNEWYYCKERAHQLDTDWSKGQFEPERCSDDIDDCGLKMLGAMAEYAARS